MVRERVQDCDYRLSLLDRRGDGRCRAAHRPGTVQTLTLRTYLGGLPLWASPAVRLAPEVPHRAGMRHIAALRAIRRIVAAIQLWRGRARSRPQLRELSDHMLKDIGLRRDDVGYDFPKLFWRGD